MYTLYAWAVPTPTSDSPVDHTWVTDYDNRVDAYPSIGAVIAAGANYWFCWGDFHQRGSSAHLPDGWLGSGAGDIAWARCLCEPNAPSDTNESTYGTIEHYGIDGVCHQLANQVLWATGLGGAKPLTVSKARGYGLSTFFYGTYGLQHKNWAARQARCAPKAVAGQAPAKGGSMSTPEDDEFAARAQSVLGSKGSSQKLTALLALRARAQAGLAAHKASVMTGAAAPSADVLNAQHRQYLKEAARLLTAEQFNDLFGIATSQIDSVELVVPSMLGQGNERPKPGGRTR